MNESPMRGECCGGSNSSLLKSLQIIRGGSRQKPGRLSTRPWPLSLTSLQASALLLCSCSLHSQELPGPPQSTRPGFLMLYTQLHPLRPAACPHPCLQITRVASSHSGKEVCLIPPARGKGLRCLPYVFQGD